MGWSKRGKNQYYYRKLWENGRAVNEYIGTGIAAEIIAEIDAERRQARHDDQESWQAMIQAVREIECAVTQVEDMVRRLTSSVLVINGFHTHKRQWRRERPASGLEENNE